MASLSEQMQQAGYRPNGGSLLSQMSAAGHTPIKAPSRDLGQHTADAYKASGQKIVESVERAAGKLNQGDNFVERTVNNVGAFSEGLLGAAAGAVQGFFAPVTGAITRFMPQRTEGFEAAQAQAQSSGMIASQTTNDNPTGQKAALAAWAEAHPDAARNLMDAFVVGTTAYGGASGLLGRTAAETTVGQGVTATRNAVVGGTKATFNAVKNPITTTKSMLPTPSEAQIESTILKRYEKGVKPNLPGKTTPSQLADYRDDVITAVRTIKENQSNLRYADDAADGIVDTIKGQMPRSLQQLTEAVEQTKGTIFSRYDALAQQAGKAGVGVKTSPIASELDIVINNKALALTNPKAIQYARQLKDRLLRTGDLDATTAQEVVQNYNKSLEAFYRNPTYDSASQAAIDALIANRMRQALDEGITGLTGESYKALKAQYGSLKAIERDVIKATLRDARKNIKGLIDYTDIFSGGQVITGLLTLNPAIITTGLAQKAIAALFKRINDPNRAIERMFKAADRLPQTEARLKSQAPSTQSPKINNTVIGSKVPQTAKSSNQAAVDAKGATPTKGAWPTTASKPSKAGSTSTGNAPTGKEGVSAQRADTSGPFEGSRGEAPALRLSGGDTSLPTSPRQPTNRDSILQPIYHGTPDRLITEFRPSKNGDLGPGIYFARNKSTAENFSNMAFRDSSLEARGDGTFVNLNTGDIVRPPKPGVIEADISKLRIKKLTEGEFGAEISKLRDPKTNVLPPNYEALAQQKFKTAGYDGIELTGTPRGENDQILVFPEAASKLSSPSIPKGTSGPFEGAKPAYTKVAQFTDEGKDGKFWTTPEGADEGFGGVRKEAFIDTSKLYKGSSSREFLEERGLLTPALRKRIEEAADSNDPNMEFKIPQDVAEEVLKKEGYSGAHWTYEDDLNPTQYQVWDKSVISTKKPVSSPSIPKELEPLAAEARKYKSAEEFANSIHLEQVSPSSRFDFEQVGPWDIDSQVRSKADGEYAAKKYGTSLEDQVIVLNERGYTLDGSHRLAALRQAGVKKINVIRLNPNGKYSITDFYNKVKGGTPKK